MHYRTLGNCGAVVSTFALGTMTFGAEADEATSHAILGNYVAAGGADQRQCAIDFSDRAPVPGLAFGDPEKSIKRADLDLWSMH